MRRREFIAGLGSAVAWPVLTRAQQRPRLVIGVLSGATEHDYDELYAPGFRGGIAEQGYVEGRNVEILYRYPEIQYHDRRLRELAADLVRRRVAVIFAQGIPSALAAKEATATIPIVFVTGIDPVQAGLLASLNRPGGNVTGTTSLIVELFAKRLELLHEIAPAATLIGYLHDPTVPSVEEPSIQVLETAARALGVRLITANASSPSEIDSALAMLVGQGVGALVVGQFFLRWLDQLVVLVTHYALPAMYTDRRLVEAGGLISYAANLLDSVRLAGTYVGRILKGEKPADLPVQQSTRIEMVINLKTAKALGLTIPETLLATADEVIE
jgi:putative tryptophan/tyrosine transport system substrate-binding protein